MFSQKELREKVKFCWEIWNKKDNSTVTYCNLFVQEVMHLLYDYKLFDGCLANNILCMMKKYSEWEKIDYMTLISDSFEDTRDHSIIIAAQHGKPSGHVVVLLPGKLAYSGKWGKHIPICANIGKTNFFGKGVSFAFKDEPEYFLYKGDTNDTN